MRLTGKKMTERFMRDRCKLGSRSSGSKSGPYTDTGASWNYAASETKCLASLGKSTMVFDGTKETMTDGGVALPLGTSISSGDRIRFTKINGRSLSGSWDFEVLGSPSETTTHLVANLRRVTESARL